MVVVVSLRQLARAVQKVRWAAIHFSGKGIRWIGIITSIPLLVDASAANNTWERVCFGKWNVWQSYTCGFNDGWTTTVRKAGYKQNMWLTQWWNVFYLTSIPLPCRIFEVRFLSDQVSFSNECSMMHCPGKRSRTMVIWRPTTVIFMAVKWTSCGEWLALGFVTELWKSLVVGSGISNVTMNFMLDAI